MNDKARKFVERGDLEAALDELKSHSECAQAPWRTYIAGQPLEFSIEHKVLNIQGRSVPYRLATLQYRGVTANRVWIDHQYIHDDMLMIRDALHVKERVMFAAIIALGGEK